MLILSVIYFIDVRWGHLDLLKLKLAWVFSSMSLGEHSALLQYVCKFLGPDILANTSVHLWMLDLIHDSLWGVSVSMPHSALSQLGPSPWFSHKPRTQSCWCCWVGVGEIVLSHSNTNNLKLDLMSMFFKCFDDWKLLLMAVTCTKTVPSLQRALWSAKKIFFILFF